MALIVEPDLKFTAEDVEKLLALMGIRFPAAAAGLDAEKMRFHGSIAPGEELHADIGAGFKDFALGRANERLSISVGFKHGQDIRFVEAGDALKGGNRGAHLTAFEGAEKADGNFGSASDGCQRKAALHAQTAEALAGRPASIGWGRDDSLFLEDMYNRGRIEAASAAKEESTLEETDVRFGVHAVVAGGALGSDEPERFPGAQSRGRNAETAGNLRDAEEALGRQRFRCCGQILSA
jgi:hypothetical protein